MAGMTDLPPELSQALKVALAAPPQRICALQLPDGRQFWLKRAERLSGRMRLQKGDGSAAFHREREGLRLLNAAGLPVPPLLAEGVDWFLTADQGETLSTLLWRQADNPKPAFTAAGQALAQLHMAGFNHGRPAIRDICWDGRAARFIDLERFDPDRSSSRAKAIDILIFVHSIYNLALKYPEDPKIESAREAAIAAYRATAPGIWVLARRLAAQLFLLRPVSWLPLKSRDLKAIAPTLSRIST
ncbi:MAG: hypothetical protein ACK5M4_15880, partial [Pseudorhodobacter sp.]